MKTIITVVCYALLLSCDAETTPSKESDMVINSTAKNYVISSPMQGVLMQNGKPLANTKIIRRLRWNGNDDGLVEEFTSDERGRFSLPIHEEELTLGTLVQFVAKTELYVHAQKEEQRIWYNSKMRPEIYTETDGSLSQLTCDLNNEEVPVYIGDSVIASISTKCRWVNMPESE